MEEPKHKSFWSIFKRKKRTEKNNSPPKFQPPPGFQQPPPKSQQPPPGFQQPPPGFQQPPPPKSQQQSNKSQQQSNKSQQQSNKSQQQSNKSQKKSCPLFTITIHPESGKPFPIKVCPTQSMTQFVETLRTVLNVPPSTSKVFYTIQLFDADGLEYEISQQLVSGPVLQANTDNLHEGSHLWVQVSAHSTGQLDFIVQRYNGSQLYISAHLSDRLSVLARKITKHIMPKGSEMIVSLVNQQGIPYLLEYHNRPIRLSDTDIRDGTIVRLIEQII